MPTIFSKRILAKVMMMSVGGAMLRVEKSNADK
jgi:hypothetical protein